MDVRTFIESLQGLMCQQKVANDTPRAEGQSMCLAHAVGPHHDNTGRIHAQCLQGSFPGYRVDEPIGSTPGQLCCVD